MAKKFLTPVVPPSLATDPANAVEGAIYYNTAVNSLKFFDGSEWSLIAAGGGPVTSSNIEVLSQAPAAPEQGRWYFDTNERTIKIWNGSIWYDVAGPKELLDHEHGVSGPVTYLQYEGYVDTNLIAQEGGSSSPGTVYTMILDGGDSSGN